jgi:hypothetical protein
MSLVTSNSIPNAVERKEKEEKEETKKEEERCSADPQPTAGSRRPWVELVAGHIEASHGSGRPSRPMASATLFFDFL